MKASHKYQGMNGMMVQKTRSKGKVQRYERESDEEGHDYWILLFVQLVLKGTDEGGAGHYKSYL
jgi:hypothetical protein